MCETEPSRLFSWEKVKSESPKARDSHSCVVFRDSLILYGGVMSGKEQCVSNLLQFCTKTKQWQRLEVFGESPPAREAHICQVVGDLLVIHGGLNEEDESFDDMWVLVGLGHKSE